MKILFVEDDLSITSALLERVQNSGVLDDDGNNFLCIYCVETAMALLDNIKFPLDLVITDMGLPIANCTFSEPYAGEAIAAYANEVGVPCWVYSGKNPRPEIEGMYDRFFAKDELLELSKEIIDLYGQQ